MMHIKRFAFMAGFGLGCLLTAGCASSGTVLPRETVSAPNGQNMPDDARSGDADGGETHRQDPAPEDAAQTQPETAAEKLSRALAEGDDAAAESLAREIIESSPVSPESVTARTSLAQIALSRKDYAQGIMIAQDALKIDEKSAQTWFVLAALRHGQAQDGEAVAALADAIRLDPSMAQAYRLRAQILIAYLDTERALDAAQKAFELAPGDCAAQIVYADALCASKRYADAIVAFESVGAQCSRPEAMLKNMAKIYEVHVPDAQKACAVYQKLVTISPDNADYKASRDYQCQTPGAS